MSAFPSLVNRKLPDGRRLVKVLGPVQGAGDVARTDRSIILSSADWLPHDPIRRGLASL